MSSVPSVSKFKKSLKTPLKCHEIWHKFCTYINKTFGSDLFGKWDYWWIQNSKTKKWSKIWFRDFNEKELYKRLVGYEIMERIRKWVERYCPEIKRISCDDSVYAGSNIFLIPHPKHGITVLFIPQCTDTQNIFFLYENHCKILIKELTEMRKVYSKNN